MAMPPRLDAQGVPQFSPEEMVDPNLPTSPIGLAPGFDPRAAAAPRPGPRMADVLPQISAATMDPTLTAKPPGGRLSSFFQKSQNFLGDNPLALALLGGLATAGVSKAYKNSPTAAINTLGLVRTFAGGMQDKREQDVQRVERARKYAKETELDAKKNYLSSLISRGPQEGQTADMFKRELYTSVLESGLDPRSFGLDMDDLLKTRRTADETAALIDKHGWSGVSFNDEGEPTYVQAKAPEAPKMSAAAWRTLAQNSGKGALVAGLDDDTLLQHGRTILGIDLPKPEKPEAPVDTTEDQLILGENPALVQEYVQRYGWDPNKLTPQQIRAMASRIRERTKGGQGTSPADWIRGAK